MRKTVGWRVTVGELLDFGRDSRSVEETRPPDWEARAQALDIRHSWIVEAPAGSGKTGLLIQRYLKLLADEIVDEPEQVLAITFTVKATEEMRARVMTQLEQARLGTVPVTEFEREMRALAEAVMLRDAERGWGLLEHPHRLRFRTIDSVCGEIARMLPVLTGGGGAQTPVEDATTMYREAARQTLMQLGGGDGDLDEALRTVLLHRDGSLADCEKLLMEMLPLRNQWGELVPLLGEELDEEYLDGTVLPRIERALEEAIGGGLARLSRSVPQDILSDLSLLAGEMGQSDGYRGAPSPIAAWAGVYDAPEEIAADLARWQGLIHLVTTKSGGWRKSFQNRYLNFEAEKSHVQRLADLLQELQDHPRILDEFSLVKSLPPATYPPEQWRVAKALFRVLRRALAELQLVFARRSECDFAEHALLAKTALEHGGARDLPEALGVELRHLLVDEMQDTSTSQYRLIELLTQGWDGQSQTVFLVGDPKQSIYIFRQARVERFVRTMRSHALGELPLGSLQLTANFRSQSGLVDAFNEDFSALFPDENDANAEEVPYVAAQAVRGPSDSGAQNVVWHTAVLNSGADAQKERGKQARIEAEQVREIIEEWRRRPLPVKRSNPDRPWKIAVLVRSRNVLGEIVAELKDEIKGAIPFRAVKIELLGERQEVLDLFALTRALLHPADRVAWFAVLHAPWCGLGLSELHVLAGQDNGEFADWCVEDLIRVRGELLSPESCARLEKVWTVMDAAVRHRMGLTASQWVERTWRSLNGDAYLTPEEMANARRYLQLLDEVDEHAGRIDLELLKRRQDDLYAEPGTAEGAVDLMTIHGAKGLEWDVVIVPGLERREQVNRDKLLTWDELDQQDQESASIVLAPVAGRGEDSKELNRWLRGIARRRVEAERKRVFYVACTRAREELHLFASPQRTAKGVIQRAPGSLLETAWDVAGRHFAADTPDSARILEMPPRAEAEDAMEFVGDLAAAAEQAQPARLRRLPLGFEPQIRFEAVRKLGRGETAVAAMEFERPEGSFEARAFGNAMHAFIEVLARKTADGAGLDAMAREVTGWEPRIAAVLRGEGLAPAVVSRLAVRVAGALGTMLKDPVGRWILQGHEDAMSELALTSWEEQRSSVRLDRVFFGGNEPLAAGSDYLWIVDYKTATHGRESADEFLVKERAKYEPQMDAYARMMKDRAPEGRLRVGLYYPMLSRMVWWMPENAG
jgi:ATP-dependent helicase/nuclease subunit A